MNRNRTPTAEIVTKNRLLNPSSQREPAGYLLPALAPGYSDMISAARKQIRTSQSVQITRLSAVELLMLRLNKAVLNFRKKILALGGEKMLEFVVPKVLPLFGFQPR